MPGRFHNSIPQLPNYSVNSTWMSQHGWMGRWICTARIGHCCQLVKQAITGRDTAMTTTKNVFVSFFFILLRKKNLYTFSPVRNFRDRNWFSYMISRLSAWRKARKVAGAQTEKLAFECFTKHSNQQHRSASLICSRKDRTGTCPFKLKSKKWGKKRRHSSHLSHRLTESSATIPVFIRNSYPDTT